MFAAIPEPRTGTRGRPPYLRQAESAAAGPVIPYDLGAAFRITGRPGNLIQDVVNISANGTFVAVGIGYGFEEERERPIGPPNSVRFAANDGSIVVGDLVLEDLPLAALIEGFRVNPKVADWVFGDQVLGAGNGGFTETPAIPGTVPADRVFSNVLQRIKTPEEISFLFSLVDSGTGREFQDQAAHNLASLGKSNGERPFRLLAQPFHFAPRSTLRLQVTERTEGVRGTLFIVLYGYRVLGAAACPEPIARRLQGPPMCPVETIGNPDARIIPFDYVSRLQLTGRRGSQVEGEVPVNADGGFVATGIGYGLAVPERNVSLQMGAVADVQNAVLRHELQEWKPGSNVNVNLGHLPLRLIPSSALLDGIRIRPGWIRIALQDDAHLAGQLPFELLDSIFERLNRPEDVSFRYALSDAGTGRELQNQHLNNIAGLGIADGDRPFKRLARPMIFLPRSVIRVEIEEVYGRGDVFIVFQGYKLLDRRGIFA
jgi:hypothetical protein